MYDNQVYNYKKDADEESVSKNRGSPLRKVAGVIIGLLLLALFNYFSGANRHFYKGYYYQNKGELQNALESYTLFIKEEPENEDAYFNRGSVYLDLGEFKKAIEDFNKAMEYKDEDYESLYSRGIAYNFLQEYEKAAKDFLNVIEIKPDFPDAYSALGGAYINLRNFSQAILYYDKAYELDDTFAASTHYFKGFAYDEMGNINEAVKNYKLFLGEVNASEYPEALPYIQDAKVRLGELGSN